MTTILNISVLLLSFVLLATGDTLKSLYVLHRHGDRTPVHPYKTDPYADASNWPDGFGQLTMKGKRRMFSIGQYLRNQYDGFLSDSIREVAVRSSDRDRCIESTQLVLNGLYKPKGRWVWRDDEPWHPLPVHTNPTYLDSMLYFAKCPAAEAENVRILSSKYAKSVNEKYKDLYSLLTEKTGEKIADVVTCSYINDVLHIEQSFNLSLPAWVTPDVLRQMEEVHLISNRLLSYTRRFQRLRVGVFLDDLTKKIEETIKAPKDPNLRKLNVYSTHDTIVSILLAGLRVGNLLPPPFGSTVIFELHQHNATDPDWDTGSSIKVFYLNETDTSPFRPYEMHVPTCSDTEICTVKQFIASVADLLLSPKEWSAECKKTGNIEEAMRIGAIDMSSFRETLDLMEEELL